jgi:hypothetical protein
MRSTPDDPTPPAPDRPPTPPLPTPPTPTPPTPTPTHTDGVSVADSDADPGGVPVAGTHPGGVADAHSRRRATCALATRRRGAAPIGSPGRAMAWVPVLSEDAARRLHFRPPGIQLVRGQTKPAARMGAGCFVATMGKQCGELAVVTFCIAAITDSLSLPGSA